MYIYIYWEEYSQLTFTPSFFRGVGMAPTNQQEMNQINHWIPIESAWSHHEITMGSSTVMLGESWWIWKNKLHFGTFKSNHFSLCTNLQFCRILMHAKILCGRPLRLGDEDDIVSPVKNQAPGPNGVLVCWCFFRYIIINGFIFCSLGELMGTLWNMVPWRSPGSVCVSCIYVYVCDVYGVMKFDVM